MERLILQVEAALKKSDQAITSIVCKEFDLKKIIPRSHEETLAWQVFDELERRGVIDGVFSIGWDYDVPHSLLVTDQFFDTYCRGGEQLRLF